MYTILMTSDKRLTKTMVVTLHQYENLVDKLKFIVPYMYEDLDLSTFKASLVYTTPHGKEMSETLNFSSELYKERWMCGYLTISTAITKYAGDVTLRLVFTDAHQRVLQSDETFITIEAYKASDSDIPECPDDDQPSENPNLNGFEVVEF